MNFIKMLLMQQWKVFQVKAYNDEDIKRLFKTYSDSDITSKKDQAKLDALEVLVNAIK